MEKFTITLDAGETEILSIWLKQVSDTTFTNLETRKAMRDLKDRFVYAFMQQMNRYKFHEESYGDFS